jgi:preprotein translocase subunit SecF
MIAATILLLIWRGGPNYGVDFSGGIVIQVRLEKKQTPSDIKGALKSTQLEDSIIREFEGESEYLIRVRKSDIELTGLNERVKQALVSHLHQGVDLRRVEMVGPQVGEDLRQKALLAIFYALLLIVSDKVLEPVKNHTIEISPASVIR